MSAVSKWSAGTKSSAVSKQSVVTTGNHTDGKSSSSASLENKNGANSKKADAPTSLPAKPNESGEEDSLYEPIVYRGPSESAPKPKSASAGSGTQGKKSAVSDPRVGCMHVCMCSIFLVI